MENDMIEPSPELKESAAKFQRAIITARYDNMQPYEMMLRGRALNHAKNKIDAGFDSNQHYTDVVYLLNLLDRERR